jgi:hypothetical protein
LDNACQLGRSLYGSKSDDRNIGFHSRRQHKHQRAKIKDDDDDSDDAGNRPIVDDGNTGRS